MKERLAITDWALEDRPREKMMIHGIRTLSDAELMAILIGSGNKKESAVELSQRILNYVDGKFSQLGKMSVEELKNNFDGIGDAKAITILAAIELGRRRKSEEIDTPDTIRSSNDAYKYIYSRLVDLSQEEFWIILLNNSNRVIDSIRISQGATNATLVDIKLIMKNALNRLARSIVACHNHPSGNPTPSEADKALTNKIKAAAELLDIKLLDHIIVAGEEYYSFTDEGKI
ncbi:MAG: DNA repair protein RadC [Bacteroidales bacterium]|nr:DNA repair protein RadC [Bacteroidales bacterium]